MNDPILSAPKPTLAEALRHPRVAALLGRTAGLATALVMLALRGPKIPPYSGD
jgi:hypothetical protein